MVGRGAHLSRTPESRSDSNRIIWTVDCLHFILRGQDSAAIIEQLLRAGAVCDTQIVHWAMRQCATESFAFLLDVWGNDPRSTSDDVEELLKEVACRGSLEIFKIVDERGLVPRATDDSELLNSLLTCAVMCTQNDKETSGREAIIKSLLAYGADINTFSKTSVGVEHPLLYWVCQWASSEFVQVFVHGQDLSLQMSIEFEDSLHFRPKGVPRLDNNEKAGYVHLASLRGHLPGVQKLLRNHASTDVTGSKRTPVHWMALRGLLGFYDYDVDEAERLSQQADEATRPIIERLMSAGVTLDARDIYGCTALHYACRLKMQKLIHVLLGLSANRNIQDNNGYAPMHHLALEFGEFNNNEFAGQIFSDRDWYTKEFGTIITNYFTLTQINALDRERGMTPLMHAVRAYHTQRTQWLLDLGADPNTLDAGGQTALHHAMIRPERFHVEPGMFFRPSLWELGDARRQVMVDVLLAAGADAEAVHNNGRTAEDVRTQEERWIGPRRAEERRARERAEAAARGGNPRGRAGKGGRGGRGRGPA